MTHCQRIFLEPGTRIKLEQRKARLTTQLISGKLYFSISPTLGLEFQAASRPMQLSGKTQGVLSIEKQGPVLKLGAASPSLMLKSEPLMARFPYSMGLPGRN